VCLLLQGLKVSGLLLLHGLAPAAMSAPAREILATLVLLLALHHVSYKLRYAN
jgi:hypothetical protein